MILRRPGWDGKLPDVLATLGRLRVERNEHAAALEPLREGLALLAHRNEPEVLLDCFVALGAVYAELGDLERAAHLLGVVDSLKREHEVKEFLSDEEAIMSRTDTLLNDALGAPVLQELREVGRHMNLDEAVQHALGGAQVTVPLSEVKFGP